MRHDHPSIPDIHHPLTDEKLSRYLLGDVSDEDRGAIVSWLQEHPEAEQRITAIREAAQLRVDANDHAAAERIADRFWAQVKGEQLSTGAVASRSRQHRRTMWQRWSSSRYAIAMSAACIALAIWGVLQFAPLNQSTIDPGVDRYATSNGQRAKVTLSDGTIVSLDVGSQLEVPRNFGETTRHVRLRGRAFFTVTSNAKSPFVVSTSTSTTRVLGTRFMVRQYDSDTSALIAVQDGKVAVGSTVLSAMQQVEVYEGRKLHVVMANSGQFTFAQGVLTLENMPVSSAIVELNRWYATDIRLADPSLSTQRIGGKFVEGSLGDLIEILEWTLNVNVVREGNVLTLYPK